MGIQGEAGVGVWSGIEYLNQVNSGISVTLGKNVVVVGGGNTAIDAARVARRQGCEVTLLYRRTRLEMPAIETEIEDALAEQVTIHYLVSPVKVKRVWGAVDAVIVQEMTLGDPDDTGRRRPIPIQGSEKEIQADSVIVAISQEPDWENLLRSNQEISPVDSSASVAGKVADDIWIGGDIRGMGIATLAISQGRKAAEEIHGQLRNLDDSNNEEPVIITPDKVHAEFYETRAALTAPRKPISEWLEQPNSEVERTITEEQFLAETTRCFSCGLCFGCQTCWMYCNASTFEHSQAVQLGNYFIPTLEICEGCGKCLDLCPCGYLSVK
jgi:Pyruvate/2-oxoacid:ferredoxin oxidoreductase delta subunit